MMTATTVNMNLDNNITMTQEQLQQLIQQSVLSAMQVNLRPTCKGDNILFTDFAEEWFNSRKDVRPTTLSKNRIYYDKHLRTRLTGKTLTQIDVPTTQALFDSIQLKPATLKIIKSVLNMIMTWADARGLIEKNPMEFVSIPKGESDHKRSLTREEITRLTEATKDERLWIVPYLCIATGMRPGELLGLKWDNVDLEGHQLFIEETFTLDAYSKTHVGEPKTKRSRRFIALDGKVAILLKQYQQEQTNRYG